MDKDKLVESRLADELDRIAKVEREVPREVALPESSLQTIEQAAAALRSHALRHENE